jgi:hypothetical protein
MHAHAHTLNSKAVNTDLKFRLRNGVGTKFSCFHCGKNLNPRNLKLGNIVRYLYAILVRTTRNKPKMWENLKSRNLKSGLYCNTFNSVKRKHESGFRKKLEEGRV